jgi:hypothetical protein
MTQRINLGGSPERKDQSTLHIAEETRNQRMNL